MTIYSVRSCRKYSGDHVYLASRLDASYFHRSMAIIQKHLDGMWLDLNAYLTRGLVSFTSVGVALLARSTSSRKFGQVSGMDTKLVPYVWSHYTFLVATTWILRQHAADTVQTVLWPQRLELARMNGLAPHDARIHKYLTAHRTQFNMFLGTYYSFLCPNYERI